MKANELRVGNVIIDKHFPSLLSIVECVSQKGIQGSYDDKIEPFDSFDGVAVTEEKLLRLGFKRIVCDNDHVEYHLEIDEFNFMCVQIDMSYSIEDNEKPLSVNQLVFEVMNFKYVHEIQNLYYELSKKELHLK